MMKYAIKKKEFKSIKGAREVLLFYTVSEGNGLSERKERRGSHMESSG